MAIRLFNEHASLTGTPIDWKIEIHDSAYVGDPVEFLVANGLQVAWRAQGDDIYSPILSSTATFEMQVQNTTHEDLIADIITANEGRFTVVVYKDAVFYWAGVVNAYDGEIEDAYYPYSFRITAVDGLALLKNFEYREETTIPAKKWNIRYTGQDKIIEILDRCIKKLPHIPTHFAGATKFIVTAINWYSNQMTTPGGATDDPFDQHYIDNRAFAQGQSSGNGKFRSAYDVIVEILRAFNARIMLVDGYFLIEQIEHRAYTIGSGANYSRYYAYDGTGPTANTLTASQDIGFTQDVKKLRGGTYSFLPPLKSVIVNQNVNAQRNLLEGAVFDDGDVEVYNVGGVFGDGLDSYVRLRFSIEWGLESIDIPVNSVVVGRFNVRFLLDGNYATRTTTFATGGTWTTTAITWSGSLAYIEVPIKMEVAAVGETWTGQGQVDLLFRTDTTFAYGNLSMSVEFDELAYFVGPTAGVVDPTDYALRWSVKDPYACIFASVNVFGLNSGTPYPKNAAWEVIGDGDNTETYDVNLLLGDRVGEVLNQWGGILYDTTGSGDFTYLTGWAARTGTRDKNLAQLLGQRIISHLYYPRKVLRGTAVGPDFSVQVPISENSDVYILKNGTLQTDRDEFNGEWVRLKYETPELTYAPVQYDTGDYDPQTPSGGASGGGSAGGPDNGGTGGGGATGNGIYGGSGTVPDGTVATLTGDFSISNAAAAAGEAFTVTIDDGGSSNVLEIEAGSGVLIQSTGDSIQLEGVTRLTDIISPTSIASSQNDYAGLDGANVGRLTASASVNLTGLASGEGGRVLFLFNRGSNVITLTDSDTGSSAANRFDSGRNYVLRAKKGAVLVYDPTDSRYLVAAIGDLSYFNEGYTTSTATTASLTADTPATNVGVALVAKGTGAVLGAVPDGTATGGNARGQYAVDWQRLRTNASDVASGDYSTIPGGRRCTASGTYSFATGFRATASGAGSVAFGGSGGFSIGATASGSNSFAFGNSGNATANNAVGFNATASAQSALAINANVDADKYGMASFYGASFLRWDNDFIVGTAATEMFLDGSSLTATIPSGQQWQFEISVYAQTTTVGNGTGVLNDQYFASYVGVIRNIGGTTSLLGTVDALMAAKSDAGISDCSFAITADNAGDYLKLTFTPPTTAGSTTQTRVGACMKFFIF